MRLWPWAKPETRAETEAASDDAVLAELLRQQGQAATVASAAVALEQGSGLWGRAFAMARPMPSTPATRALRPSVLAHIGRWLAIRGDVLFAIESAPGGIRLVPVSSWDVRRNWRYLADIPLPDRTVTRSLPAEAVVHCRYATRPAQPWRGVPPLAFAPSTADLAGRIDQSLSREYRGPSGTILFGSELSVGISDEQMDELTADLASGKMVAFGQTRRNFDPNSMDAAMGDSGWMPPNSSPTSERVGPAPPPVAAALRDSVAADVRGALGIPPALYGNNAAASREGWRQFLHSTISPIARLVAEELSDKLQVPDLSFDFTALQASDIAGRARAFSQLTRGGMDAGVAREVAGL